MSTVSPEIWAATIAGLVGIVVLDLTVIARRNRTVSVRDATVWVIFYVALAAAFGAVLYFLRPESAGEFVAGYITEYSLSVDNLFVFVIIMARFGVPAIAQDKVLYIGIILSLVMRAVLIAAGAAAVAAASWVFYLFGALLIYTAVKLALEKDDDDEPEFNENVLVRTLRRFLPMTDDYAGSSMTTRVDGQRVMTPMVLVMAAIAVANVVFALDSIPAIFGLTQDAYVVFTANAFALMGLRQLYFLIGGLLKRLVYLNLGLSVILGFIGVKLLIEALHGSHIEEIGGARLPDIGTAFSLEFIVGTLVITAAASIAKDVLEKRKVLRAGEESSEPARADEDAVNSDRSS